MFNPPSLDEYEGNGSAILKLLISFEGSIEFVNFLRRAARFVAFGPAEG
jgi:hypothetical protein